MPLLGHVHCLSEVIGPRGSTTEGEAQASDYVRRCLSELGLQPEQQPILSATSAYAPFILAIGAMLLGLLLFWQPQPVGAAAAFVIGLTAFASVLLELSLTDNPLRWVIPIHRSQNTLAVVPASAQVEKRPPILITAHVDTHRTPLLFSSPGWRRVFRAIMSVGLTSMAVLVVLFIVGVFVDSRTLRQFALVPGAVVAVIGLFMIQAASSPFTRGANDNASGVAVALVLAEKLVQQPLQHHDVILAFTGCEEVGAYGAQALIAARRRDLRGAIHLVIDHVGGAKGHDYGPSIIRSERFLRRAESDPRLVQIAQRVAAGQPELHAAVRDFRLAYSELSVGAKHGLRALGLMGLTPEGDLPNWHVPEDVSDRLDEATLERTVAFAWHLLQAIDVEDIS